jgi:MFS transporter, DHA3 family, macrolide efflux protein
VGDLKGGLLYVKGWPGLVMIGIMATIINLVLNPGFALLPLLVTGHFKGRGPATGLDAVRLGYRCDGGGLLLSVWGGFQRRILTSLLGLLLIGSGSLVVGISLPRCFCWPWQLCS